MTVRIETIGNGLRVATDAMPGVRTASVGIWVGAGTRVEPADINGVAHFLEHMAFKGTKRRSARQIAEEMEAAGGHMNAYTARENTAYFAKVLSEELPLAVDIIADIMTEPSFDPAELERERGVILQEIGQCHDTPDDVVFDYFQECAFPDQGMGRPVLGTAETVRAMSRDAISGFMSSRYGTDSMILCAAGDVDHDRIMDLAADRLGDVAGADAGMPEPAHYEGGDIRIDRDCEQVHLLLGFNAPSFREADHYAVAVLSSLLGGGMSSRLFQSVREERGLVYSIYSFVWPFSDTGLFGIYAGTGEQDVVELIPVVAEELLGVTETIGAEEIARAKTQIKSGLLMGREGTGGRCDQLGSQMLAFGRSLSESEQIAAVDAVSEADLKRVAAGLLSGRPTVAALGPVRHLESYDKISDRLRIA
ncbi:MAG: pitrilysin family protein [Alphaproteobacteria bacterium]